MTGNQGFVSPLCSESQSVYELQTVNRYQEALALGQTAFETSCTHKKPVPHIFGSAAYIQDVYAGLRSLHSEQDDPAHAGPDNAPNGSQGVNGSTRAAIAGQVQETTPISNLCDMAEEPQTFKAMLEAALKGNVAVPQGVNHQSVYVGQDQGSVHQDSPAEDAQGAEGNAGMPDSKQASEHGVASTDLPHVLVWLEKGRSLFDDDDETDANPDQQVAQCEACSESAAGHAVP